MKLLFYFVPRFGTDDRLVSRIVALGEQWAERFGVGASGWNPMFRVPEDPFGRKTLFRASLEFLDLSVPPGDVAAVVSRLDEELDDLLHADLSLVLVGEERVFIESERMPLRMQYLMRRRADLSRAAYRAHYEEVHSQIGLRTPGIAGYAQFYVDAQATRMVAAAAGFAGAGVDSVSQLSLESVDAFLEAVSTAPIGREAIADERTFVDRRNSLDFFSRVLWPGEREANAAGHPGG